MSDKGDYNKMNNEQIMNELQSSFDSDYGVSQQLIDNVERIIQENEKLQYEIMDKELINDGMKEDRRVTIEEIREEYFISKDKIREKIQEIENECCSLCRYSGELCEQLCKNNQCVPNSTKNILKEFLEGEE